jgi:hypothetical protein
MTRWFDVVSLAYTGLRKYPTVAGCLSHNRAGTCMILLYFMVTRLETKGTWPQVSLHWTRDELARGLHDACSRCTTSTSCGRRLTAVHQFDVWPAKRDVSYPKASAFCDHSSQHANRDIQCNMTGITCHFSPYRQQQGARKRTLAPYVHNCRHACWRVCLRKCSLGPACGTSHRRVAIASALEV